jgi:hypothetical protein
MRILIFITFLLSAFAAFWCAAAAYGEKIQRMETSAELSAFRQQPLTKEAIAGHLSRQQRQARNLAIGGSLSGAAAVVALVCLIRTGKRVI